MRIKAHYRCLRCGFEWITRSGTAPGCPMCGHEYFLWVDFKGSGPGRGTGAALADKLSKSRRQD